MGGFKSGRGEQDGDLVISDGTIAADSYKGTVVGGITAYGSATGASSTAEATAASFTIAANTLVAGDRLVINCIGNFTAAGTPALVGKLKISDGTTTHILHTLTNGSAASSGVQFSNVDTAFLSIGATARFSHNGMGSTGAAVSVAGGIHQVIATTATITVSWTTQFDASHSSNTFTVRELSASRTSVS
tara:strand:+ start:8025 stop:8591 length:567 start_codon:yes stop_codon:yes gene_type:complete